MSRRFWSLVLVPLFAFVGAAQEPKKDDAKKDTAPKETKILVRSERTDPVYELDEPAGFLFASNTGGELIYRMTDDGIEPIKDGKFRVQSGKTYRLETKVEKPCFLRVELDQLGAKTMTIAAVAPTKIEPSLPAPADFAEYWRQQRQALADVKIGSDHDFVAPFSNQLLTTTRLTLGSIDGRRIHAWMTVPKGSGPYPVIITLPTAGVRPLYPDLTTAALGAITIELSVHDLPLDAPEVVYQTATKKELANYWNKGIDDKTQTYLRYAVLAGVRAIDYVSDRKDFNGQIAVTGSRQGGGLAIMIAGLDSRVTHLAADLPAFCDVGAKVHNHLDSWPRWIAQASPDLKEKVKETAGYFDPCNFAGDFKGKSLVRVGYYDDISSARSVYAAYNRLAGPKEMILAPTVSPNDPRWSAQWATKRLEFLQANLTMSTPVFKYPPPPPTPPQSKLPPPRKK